MAQPLCYASDLEKMPIEDATVRWDEGQSPFVAAATLEAEPQNSPQHGTSDRFDGALSFSSRHGIEAHRPLVGVNRTRNERFRRSAQLRGRFIGCSTHQPRSAAELESTA